MTQIHSGATMSRDMVVPNLCHDVRQLIIQMHLPTLQATSSCLFTAFSRNERQSLSIRMLEVKGPLDEHVLSPPCHARSNIEKHISLRWEQLDSLKQSHSSSTFPANLQMCQRLLILLGVA